MDFTERVRRFYEKYAPDKVGNVEKILVAYKGKEEILIAELVKKYGPEPAVANEAFRLRLAKFYEFYAPDKVASIDRIIQHYIGREETAFEDLAKKYGPEPQQNVASKHEQRLKEFYAFYAPEKLDNVKLLLEKFKGSEESMMQELVAKYGPEPARAAFAKRLQGFFEKYLPDKLGQIDSFVEKYAHREDELMKSLTTKFGPEPARVGETSGEDTFLVRVQRLLQMHAPSRVPNASAMLTAYKGNEEELIAALEKKFEPDVKSEVSMAKDSDLEGRVRRIVETYAPDKLGQCGQLLAKYSGREEELVRALVSKYGPEPSPTNSTNQSQDTATNQSQDAATKQSQDFFTSCEEMLRFSVGQRGLDKACHHFVLGNETAAVKERIMILVTCVEKIDSIHNATDDLSILNAITPNHTWTHVPNFLLQLSLQNQSILQVTAARAFELRDNVAQAEECMLQLFEEYLVQSTNIENWRRQDCDRVLQLAHERRHHRYQVVNRALDMIGSIEASTRIDLWKLQDVEAHGLTMWFRERRREIATSFDSTHFQDVELRFKRWRALLDGRTI